MKARLKDGTIVDLGTDYITIVGEEADGKHIVLQSCRIGLSVGSIFDEVHHCNVKNPNMSYFHFCDTHGNIVAGLKSPENTIHG